MPRLTLKFKREHGYAYTAPITDRADRGIASFVGVSQDHPWMQRPIDAQGNRLPPEAEPREEDRMYWRNVWQRVLVYASDDGGVELCVRVPADHDPAPAVEVEIGAAP